MMQTPAAADPKEEVEPEESVAAKVAPAVVAAAIPFVVGVAADRQRDRRSVRIHGAAAGLQLVCGKHG